MTDPHSRPITTAFPVLEPGVRRVAQCRAGNAITFAAGTVLGAAVVTSEFKINYLRPAIGEVLLARAAVLYAGRTQAVCRCELFVRRADEETLCAAAQGTVNVLSASRTGGERE